MGYKLILVLAWVCVSVELPAQSWQDRIYTIQYRAVKFPDSSKQFIILKHSKTCLKCYGELFKYLKQQRYQDYHIDVIASADSNIFSMKMEAKEVQKLLPDISRVLFDYRTTDGQIPVNSVFNFYKVDITPALIKLENGKATYYSYDKIFNGTEVILALPKL